MRKRGRRGGDGVRAEERGGSVRPVGSIGDAQGLCEEAEKKSCGLIGRIKTWTAKGAKSVRKRGRREGGMECGWSVAMGQG